MQNTRRRCMSTSNGRAIQACNVVVSVLVISGTIWEPQKFPARCQSGRVHVAHDIPLFDPGLHSRSKAVIVPQTQPHHTDVLGSISATQVVDTAAYSQMFRVWV